MLILIIPGIFKQQGAKMIFKLYRVLYLSAIQPDSLVVALIAHDASQPGSQNGSIDMEIIGGIAPYHIVWSNGDTIEDPAGLPPREILG